MIAWRLYSAFDTYGQGSILVEGLDDCPPMVGDVVEFPKRREIGIKRYKVLSRTWEHGHDKMRLTAEDLEP